MGSVGLADLSPCKTRHKGPRRPRGPAPQAWQQRWRGSAVCRSSRKTAATRSASRWSSVDTSSAGMCACYSGITGWTRHWKALPVPWLYRGGIHVLPIAVVPILDIVLCAEGVGPGAVVFDRWRRARVWWQGGLLRHSHQSSHCISRACRDCSRREESGVPSSRLDAPFLLGACEPPMVLIVTVCGADFAPLQSA